MICRQKEMYTKVDTPTWFKSHKFTLLQYCTLGETFYFVTVGAVISSNFCSLHVILVIKKNRIKNKSIQTNSYPTHDSWLGSSKKMTAMPEVFFFVNLFLVFFSCAEFYINNSFYSISFLLIRAFNSS